MPYVLWCPKYYILNVLSRHEKSFFLIFLEQRRIKYRSLMTKNTHGIPFSKSVCWLWPCPGHVWIMSLRGAHVTLHFPVGTGKSLASPTEPNKLTKGKHWPHKTFWWTENTFCLANSCETGPGVTEQWRRMGVRQYRAVGTEVVWKMHVLTVSSVVPDLSLVST